ncbi:MAG: hypothetical protein M3261_01100, partial [Thermoproteota archaeon]|nr:hypothetical protein [Thermoproteota archaeon]
GTLSATTANTNSAGYATVDSTVSRQPGDNFRVAATVNQADLAALTTNFVAGDTNDNYVPAGNDQVESFRGKLTEMLTVWRRLHVEVDTMGPVTGNTFTTAVGTTGITRTEVQAGGNILCRTDQALNDASVQPGRFEEGILTDSNGDLFNVVSNGNGPNFQVIVSPGEGEGGIPALGAFTMVDDDPSHGGDDGQPVPPPNTSLMAEKFEPAYVEVRLDGANFGWDQTNAPFHLNFQSIQVPYLNTIGTESRQSNSQPFFWTTHCVGAFQPATDPATGGTYGGDADPNPRFAANGQMIGGEATISGVSSYRSAFVFSEANQEYNQVSSVRAHTLVHEVGHSFGMQDEYTWTPPPYPADPNYNGIMYWVWQGVFAPRNLATIRGIDYPSH